MTNKYGKIFQIALVTVTVAVSLSIAANAVFGAPSVTLTKTDVNGDGVFDQKDHISVRDTLINQNYGEAAVSDYDVNGDGKTDAVDFVLLKQKYSHDLNEQLKNDCLTYGIEYERDGRTLVWHDEFDGDCLDTSKWRWDPPGDYAGNLHYVTDDTTTVFEDGIMHLIAYYSEDEGLFIHSKGLISEGTMLYKYGFAELRCKLSSKRTTWQSWWSTGATQIQRYEWFGEIDMFEASATGGDAALHKWGRTVNSHQLERANNIPNHFSIAEDEVDEYHTYTMLWTPEKLECTCDGEVYVSFDITENGDWDWEKSAVTAYGDYPNTPIPGMEGFHDYQRMYISNGFTSAMNTSDYELQAHPEDMPIEMYVDYLRIWQNPETDGLLTTDEIYAQAKYMR